MTVAASAIAGARTPGSRSRWLAWTSVVLYIALAGTSLAFESRFVGQVTLVDIWSLLSILGCAVIFALIVSTHDTHPIVCMFCGSSFSIAFAFSAREFAL